MAKGVPGEEEWWTADAPEEQSSTFPRSSSLSRSSQHDEQHDVPEPSSSDNNEIPSLPAHATTITPAAAEEFVNGDGPDNNGDDNDDDDDGAAYARHVAQNDPEREAMLSGGHLTSAQFSRGGLSVSDLLNHHDDDDDDDDDDHGARAAAAADVGNNEGDRDMDAYCLGTGSSRLNLPSPFQVDSDADSAMGDITEAMSTASLRSSIYEYVEEHGRTFHRYKQGKYWMPNDQSEQERLDLQHAVFMELLKGRYGLAPVINPQAVLDVGTGTGIWAIEFASENPSAHVIGTDLSPIQPEYVPSNCHFEVDDAEDTWLYHHPFDYIHLRMVFHSFRSHQAVMQSAYDNLEPGGWMEWQDYYPHLQSVDGSLAGTALEKWTQLYVEGGLRLGRDMLAPRKYKSWMEEVGFVNVVEQKLVIPGNPWPKGADMKLLGVWQMTNFLEGIHAVTMTIFTRGLGMSAEEVELLLVDVRKDIKNLGVHFYFLTYFVYGQKPFPAAGSGAEMSNVWAGE
ncbi:S-adenosyl-L-methionine-dependent methyltransferase [Podospora appendiculata]|uniref:S-adenosyl-L-methionine-dependent methyltransferase n=1 Tax=Podospora appendiculata TaxID=314037 RepID=A0AAE1C7I1_9PEZI|nr:S-adenosyl-L-methionine-dependent methyltransferase [Podospora appendiculata]